MSDSKQWRQFLDASVAKPPPSTHGAAVQNPYAAAVTPEKRQAASLGSKPKRIRTVSLRPKCLAFSGQVKKQALKERLMTAKRFVYCIGGVSGAGKSYMISRHPKLKHLPKVDIADDYESMGKLVASQSGTYKVALNRFSERLMEAVKKNSSSNIVAELLLNFS